MGYGAVRSSAICCSLALGVVGRSRFKPSAELSWARERRRLFGGEFFIRLVCTNRVSDRDRVAHSRLCEETAPAFYVRVF